jgi:hypothetical protein
VAAYTSNFSRVLDKDVFCRGSVGNPRGESRGHRALKRQALAWARERDLVLAACEVRVPRSPYRADVVAATRGVATGEGAVALFECKQSRADFLRDESDEPDVRRTALEVADRLRAPTDTNKASDADTHQRRRLLLFRYEDRLRALELHLFGSVLSLPPHDPLLIALTHSAWGQ